MPDLRPQDVDRREHRDDDESTARTVICIQRRSSAASAGDNWIAI
jgi:hypothetical protein